MPNLNILTWNSTGETTDGQNRLQVVIDYLVGSNWQPQVIVVQEANQAPNGCIYRMLNGLPGVYRQPPSHATEQDRRGRGYLLLTHDSVQIEGDFERLDLGNDRQLVRSINALPTPRDRQIAAEVLQGMRMPAVAKLICDGAEVAFLTWHMPRGPGLLLRGATLQGGGNPDAFWLLQNSGHYTDTLTAPGDGNIGMIAGDLNITFRQINSAGILPGWVGFSNCLDHVIAHPAEGDGNPDGDGWNFDAPGTHAILAATVRW